RRLGGSRRSHIVPSDRLAGTAGDARIPESAGAESRKGIGGFQRSLQQQLGELLSGVGEGQALAGPGVEFVGDGVKFCFGDGAEVGALVVVLAQQPVGVLVDSALPGGVWVTEDDVDAHVAAGLLPVALLRVLVSG